MSLNCGGRTVEAFGLANYGKHTGWFRKEVQYFGRWYRPLRERSSYDHVSNSEWLPKWSSTVYGLGYEM